jgi:hypothetical protein
VDQIPKRVNDENALPVYIAGDRLVGYVQRGHPDDASLSAEILAENFVGKLKVGKVNAVGNRMLCAGLKVLGLPTFIIYKSGQEITRLTGNHIGEEEIMGAVEAALR